MVYVMCCSCGYLLRLRVEDGPPPHECPACPSGAITGRHFTTEQIMAEIEGVLV